MDAVAALHEIPLNRLVLSPANARKTPASAADDAELKASIAAHGLKQNLIVGRADAEGKHAVIAGGRRLRALHALSADGLVAPDRPVPCLIEAPDSALETSLVENAVRVAMHPADQFEAFAALVDAGQTIAAIAVRFGVAERLVRQRLRLGKVAPDLLAAYRNGQMDLETLTAFTLSDDHDAQRAVWAEASQHYGRSPIQIRRRLTETAIPVASRLGRFVGIEAYETAGGAITRDLFCDHDEGFMDDAALVRRLAQTKLDAEAAALAPDWKWARPVLDPALGITADYGRVEPTPAEPSPDLRAVLDDLAQREDNLANVAAEDWSADHEAEAEDIAARQEEVGRTLAARATFAEADRRRAGCLITIGPDGLLRVLQGMIDPADRAIVADGVDPAGPDAATETPKGRGFSQALIDDLKAHRLQIAKAHLAQDFAVAFDLALFTLCRAVLGFGYTVSPLDLRAVPTREASSLDDLDGTPAAVLLAAQREALSLAWLSLPADQGFQSLCALPDEAKAALFAWCVAQCLKPQLASDSGADPALEQVGARLRIDAAGHWRPTADNYWSRVTKAHALEVGGEILGDRWRRDHLADKKPALAKALEAAFAGDATALGFDAATARRAAAWLPSGMAFGETPIPVPAGTTSPNPPPAPIPSPVDDGEEALPAFLTADLDPIQAGDAS